MEKDFLVTKIEKVMLFRKQKSFEKYTNTLPNNELIFDFAGEYVINIGDATLNVVPNTIRFIPCGTFSKYEIKRNKLGECIDIYFDADKPLSDVPFTIDASDKEYIGSLFKKLFSVWTSKGEGYYFESLSLVYKILANLQKTNYLPIDQYSLIEPAINEIEKNFLYKNLTNEYLASVCGISETRLARIFKKKFGFPIKKYIIQKKMNYACELLRLNRYSVAQIADMCNFSDVYFFSKQFKAHTGTTPTEYIKNAQF